MAAYLFVYGTLRPVLRHPAFDKHLAGHVQYIDQARCPGRLLDLGTFPGLLPPADGGEEVVGDLLELPEDNEDALLKKLDTYEGPGFERTTQTVTLPQGTEVEAYVYTYEGPPGKGVAIQSGDWVRHQRGRPSS